MRLRITLEQSRPGQLIPINYQYYLSSFIYNTLESADSEYSQWLHDNGYRSGNKSFKFFTFSMLNLKNWESKGSYILIKSPRIEFTISLLTQKMAEKFVVGMFQEKTMEIFDHQKRAHFKIKTVEAIPEIEFTDNMTFRAKSPIAIKRSRRKENENIYVSPEETDFTFLMKKNLEEKYVAKCLNENTIVQARGIDEINIIGESKGKLIRIREGDYSETSVKGYFCTFEITGNPEIIKLGYETGFGINNSLGFGYVELNKDNFIPKQRNKQKSVITEIEQEIKRIENEEIN